MKKLLVSNTGPLIALSLVNRLDILPKLYEKVVIPEEVKAELLASEHERRRLSLPAWVHVKKLSSRPDPLLAATLDKGEAAVIHLARHLTADEVLIDERKGRKVARAVYDLNVVGTAGILVRAKQIGLVDNVRDLLQEMKALGYWIHEDIVSAAANAANEP